MGNRYEPNSDFLNAILAGNVPLPGDELENGEASPLRDELSEANLRALIRLMEDDDVANRDWATFFLAQTELDRPDIRDALLRASRDAKDDVRCEALLGLAQRDTGLALPLVREALRGDTISIPLMEAASLCADPSLLADLEAWTEVSGFSSRLNKSIAEALAACGSSTPPDRLIPVVKQGAGDGAA